MSQKIIHWRIAKIARELALEAYEVMAQENAFYKLHPSMKWYVAKHWNDYIPFARQALSAVLAHDYAFEIQCGQTTAKDVDAMKEDIYQALLIDGSFKTTPLANIEPMNQIPA